VSLRRSFAFDIDMQQCPNSGGGELNVMAAILERSVIEKILSHLGLDPQPPARVARARRGKTSQPVPRWSPSQKPRTSTRAAPPRRSRSGAPRLAGSAQRVVAGTQFGHPDGHRLGHAQTAMSGQAGAAAKLAIAGF